MSEDKSADSPSAPAAPGEPATTSIPRQSFGEAPSDSPDDSVEQSFGTAPEPAPEPPPAPGPPPAPVVQSLGAAEPEPSLSSQVTGIVPPPKKNRGVLIGSAIVVVIVLVVAVVGFLLYQQIYTDPTKSAAVGDCLVDLPVVNPGEDREAKGAKVVGCDDAAGGYRVEGRLDNQTPDQAKSADVCKDFPDATFIYRAVPDSGTGYVLCLKKLG